MHKTIAMNCMGHSCLFSDHQKTPSSSFHSYCTWRNPKVLIYCHLYPLTFAPYPTIPHPPNPKNSFALNQKINMPLSKKRSIICGCLLLILCIQVLSSLGLESFFTLENEGSKPSKRFMQDREVHGMKLVP